MNGMTNALVKSLLKRMLLVSKTRTPARHLPKPPSPRSKPSKRFLSPNPRKSSRPTTNTLLSLPSVKLTLVLLLRSVVRTKAAVTRNGLLPKNCPARRRRRVITSLVNPRTRQGIGNARPSRSSTLSRGLSNPEKAVVVVVPHVVGADVAAIEVVVGVVTGTVVIVVVIVAVIVAVIVVVIAAAATMVRLGVVVALSILQTPVLSRAWESKSLGLSHTRFCGVVREAYSYEQIAQL